MSRNVDETNAIKEFIDSNLDLVLAFIEFTLSQRPNLRGTETAARMRILQKRIQQADVRFLNVDETVELQRELMTIIIHWNPSISRQLQEVNNYYVDLNRRQDVPIRLTVHNPLETVFKERARFLQADLVFNNTLSKFKDKLADEIDIYSIFYCIILSVETIEYALYQSFSNGIKQFGLENKYDPNAMFSVTTKKKSKKGFQTDSRMVRNALAHFDYEFEFVKDTFTITFHNPVYQQDSMKFNDVEFFKFLERHKFLMQSIHFTHSLMMAFSTMRHYYAIE